MELWKNKKHKLTVGVITIALFVIFSTVALASYIYSAIMNTYIATAGEEFYFTSNLLTDEPTVPTYQITHDWQTEATAIISFELRNYENPLNVSDSEIGYNVVTAPVGGSTTNTSGTISDDEPTGQRETVNLSVPTPANPQLPLEVMVTANATSPYHKTIQGKFIISPAISYQMAENTGLPVATMTITLAQSSGLSRSVIIAWPLGAAPDMTNPIVIGANSIDLANRTLTTSLNTAAIYELVFFKDSVEINYTGVTATGA